MISARVFAGLAFLASLIFLVVVHRRLGERARADEADSLLREAFERLDPPVPPGDGPARSA